MCSEPKSQPLNSRWSNVWALATLDTSAHTLNNRQENKMPSFKKTDDDKELFKYLKTMTQLLLNMKHTTIGGFASIEAFLLMHGRSWTVPQAGLPRDIRRGDANQCFMNAAHLALEDDRFTYCEGVAAGIIPMAHAWCADKNGLVIDNTWEHGKAYWGVAVKQSYLRRTLLKRKVYGLIYNWEQHWPMLTDDPKRWSHKLNKT